MGSLFSNIQNTILLESKIHLFYSLFLGCLITIIIVLCISSSLYLRCILERFIRIQIRKRLMDRTLKSPNKDAFILYYRNSLCCFQKINDELLGKILQNNHSCAFFLDRSISFLSSHRPSSSSSIDRGYGSIDDFREKVPLTTYDDYRSYIDRMIHNGEQHLLSSDKTIYFAVTSGTTGKSKILPVTKSMYRKTITLANLTLSLIWRSLPSSSYPFPDQQSFILYIGKKANMFSKSQDGIPIGPISQLMSAVSPIPGLKFIISLINIIPFDLIESIPHFETSTYVQLVFALTIPNIYVYSVTFASGFIHSIKLIEHYYEEMCRCISSANFDHSSLVRDNVHDLKVRLRLNQTLKKVALEYGGLSYRIARAEHIHNECMKKDVPGILSRLWPSLIYASTATGSTFAMYKKEVEFYCGKQLPIVNLGFYASSEGFFGCLASISTDEYFLLPNIAFYEFIKEDDIHQAGIVYIDKSFCILVRKKFFENTTHGVKY
ncbi:unnamed protein product [Rotaria sp. Silwood1]|nr:unnamed protein product [Rotaria sp. Silwood1]